MIMTRHPMRHPIQIIVCMSHLYGDTLYYATSLFDHYVNNKPYCRPEPYYFWVYYFGMNFIWIVVPFCMMPNTEERTRLMRLLDYLCNSIKTISTAMQSQQVAAQRRKAL